MNDPITTPDEAFFTRMRDHLEKEFDWYGMDEENTVECLQAAFAAATSPPRPDEPLGLGAVVEDEDGRRFVRVGPTIGDFHWRSSEPSNSDCFPWRSVKAVRVLSEGVPS